MKFQIFIFASLALVIFLYVATGPADLSVTKAATPPQAIIEKSLIQQTQALAMGIIPVKKMPPHNQDGT